MTNPPNAAVEISRELDRLADPCRAATLTSYFQVRPGGYGEGDVFLGVRSPQIRATGRPYAASASDEDLATLLTSPVHEHRFAALAILDDRARRVARQGRVALEPLARFYLEHLDRVDNWDLVDMSAPRVLGGWLATTTAASGPVAGQARDILDTLADSSSRWRRRIAVMSTWAFTRNGRPGWTLAMCDRLARDPDDLVSKAMGWMLREVGGRDVDLLIDYLDRAADGLPRVTVRYAVERLPPEIRVRYVTTGRRRGTRGDPFP
jgi:3-methyladenine DNA glycosylase AlkD